PATARCPSPRRRGASRSPSGRDRARRPPRASAARTAARCAGGRRGGQREVGKEPVPADRFDDDCDPPYIDGKRFPKVVEDPVSQTVSASAPPAAPGAPGSSQVPARSTGSRTRFRQIWRSSWRALAFVAVMIVAWWLVTSRGWVQPYILP